MPVGKNLRMMMEKIILIFFGYGTQVLEKFFMKKKSLMIQIMQPVFLLINYLFLDVLVLLFIKRIIFMEIDPLKIIKTQAWNQFWNHKELKKRF